MDLNPAQAANFARFVNKLPAGAGTAFVDALGSDNVMFTAEVPGRVPGSSAVYQKIVDAGSENMYGLDKATDLSFLIDQETIQLAIGIHDCQLVFSKDARISMQCELTFKSDATSQLIRSEIANESKELYPLLGQRIKAIEIGEAGNLKLFFSGSHELTLYDSSESFESYIIWNKGDFIAV